MTSEQAVEVTRDDGALQPPDRECDIGPQSPEQRADTALRIRYEAAKSERARPIPDHPCNGDEAKFADQNFFASYTKGLPHFGSTAAFPGEVRPEAYMQLLTALRSGAPDDFNLIPLGCICVDGDGEAQQTASRFAPSLVGGNCPRRLVNPQAALAFDLEGADSHHLQIPPAPKFDSAEEASEMIELYWMALARDVPFSLYGQEPITQAAINDLNAFAQTYPNAFTWPCDLRSQGCVTARTLFRGTSRNPDGSLSELDGSYLSQFLLLDIPFGAQRITPTIRTVLPFMNPDGSSGGGMDYLTEFEEWLAVQNGCPPAKKDQIDIEKRRFIRNGRDIGQYVHIDVLFQAYFNAMLILLQPPSTSNDNAGIGAPFDPGNPYQRVPNQEGFGTFGGPHLASLLCEVATRALKAVWYQKWSVHRRLRPEEFGGRVERIRTNPDLKQRYPVHEALLTSQALKAIEQGIGLHPGYRTHLLPQAFPEGSPLHPAYGAGHATVAGACVTILKAWFDEEFVIPKPQTLDAQGERVAYTAPAGERPLTVRGELNKLAANIAIGRNHAGVHWRSDYTASIRLGEEVAISILQDQVCTYNEDFSFSLTRFDGSPITISKGARPC